MSHKITTTVTHRIELDEREQFDHANEWSRTGRQLRIVRLTASVIDGSLSGIVGTGRPILKTGALGQVESTVHYYRGTPNHERVLSILAARGVRGATR